MSVDHVLIIAWEAVREISTSRLRGIRPAQLWAGWFNVALGGPMGRPKSLSHLSDLSCAR